MDYVAHYILRES